MNSKQINHIAFIYHGSSGVAGGYTAKFVDGLARTSKIDAFVNCRYLYQHNNPNITIHRIFFPITDNYLKKKTLIRYVVRFIELLLGYAIVAAFLGAVRTKYVIYSPITNLFITKAFVSLAKRLSGQLAIVIHDSQSLFDVSEGYRDSVYLNADILIVHNKHSYEALKQRLPVSSSAVVSIPFPWSLSKMPSSISTASDNVLLIGNVRPSKGINFLLDAYPNYKKSGGKLGLTIAGSMRSSERDQVLTVASRVIDSTLDDQQFLDEMAASKFIIMPYRPGYSNSSVHYCAVIHCRKPFICSDIELFRDFTNGVDCLKFEYGNSESFAKALLVAEGFDDYDCSKMAAGALKIMEDNMLRFDISISEFFI